MPKGRVEWIDVARGISLLLIVLFHFQVENTWSSAVSEYTKYFRLPFFFFIGGYLHRFRPSGAMATRKARFLLFPYFTMISLNVVFLMVSLAVQILQWDVDAICLNLGHILSLLSGDVIDGTYIAPIWFLPVYFLAQIMFNITGRKRNLLLAGIPLIFAVEVLINYYLPEVFVPYHLDEVPRVLLFYSIGYLFRIHDAKRLYYLIPAYVIGVFLLHSKELNYVTESSFIFLTAIGGIALAITVSKGLCRNSVTRRLLSFIGERGIGILIFHVLVGQVIFLDSPLLKVVTAVAISVSLFELFHRHPLSSLLFLGRKRTAGT